MAQKSLIEKIIRVIANDIEAEYGKFDPKFHNMDKDCWIANCCMHSNLDLWKVQDLYNRVQGFYFQQRKEPTE